MHTQMLSVVVCTAISFKFTLLKNYIRCKTISEKFQMLFCGGINKRICCRFISSRNIFIKVASTLTAVKMTFLLSKHIFST